MTEPSALIQTALAARVLTVTLDRPNKRNALTVEMYSTLSAILADAAADPEVRCLVITGTGTGFCAGNDMQDFLTRPPTTADHPVLAFMGALARLPKPLVAAVHGAAVGVGATMLLHCDLVYAARDTRLQTPFVNLGLVPEAGSSLLLPAMLGQRRAAELLLLGEPIDAHTALALGLINAVTDDVEAARAKARETAVTLATKPPAALARTKALMRDDGGALQRRIRDEAGQFAECLASPELKEAVSAFLEKRPPDFSRF